jgi:hypothetical protein
MVLRKITITVFLSVFALTGIATPAWSADKIHIVVKTVLASQDEEYVDPSLSDLAKELQSLFRYSSYRLLGQKSTTLERDQTATMSLPGGRSLKITPLETKGDRVTLRLEIIKDGRQIFQTQARLLNRSSITVGGPKYQGGYLLFNIFGSY